MKFSAQSPRDPVQGNLPSQKKKKKKRPGEEAYKLACW